MNTTTIHFKEKQKFSTILKVIEQNFNVTRIQQTDLSKLVHVAFQHKGEDVSCYFHKDNKMYYNDGRLLHISTLSSDMLSSLKDEAFEIIASRFNCILWLNDNDENSNVEYSVPKAEKEDNDEGYIWVMIEDSIHYPQAHHCAKKIEVLHEKAKAICLLNNLQFTKSDLPEHTDIFADGESVHFGLPHKSEDNLTRKEITFSCYKKKILQ